MGQEIWQKALQKNNIEERQLLDRYDLVIHLGTCAKGGDYEWGPGSNNPGRYHSPEEAVKLDGICEGAYRGHKQFRAVPHGPSFQDKVEQVMKYLEDALGVDGLAGRRCRTSVRLGKESVPTDVLKQSQAFSITSTYLDHSMELSVQRRLRVSAASWLDGMSGEKPTEKELPISSSHLDQTFEERQSVPAENFLARRVMQEAAYHNQVRLAQHKSVVKNVMTFESGAGQHYELFYFEKKGMFELILDHTVGSELPSWLVTVGDTDAQLHPSPGKRPRKLARHSTADEAQVQVLSQLGS